MLYISCLGWKILQRRKLRHREVKKFPQGNTAHKWWLKNPDLFDLKAYARTTTTWWLLLWCSWKNTDLWLLFCCGDKKDTWCVLPGGWGDGGLWHEVDAEHVCLYRVSVDISVCIPESAFMLPRFPPTFCLLWVLRIHACWLCFQGTVFSTWWELSPRSTRGVKSTGHFSEMSMEQECLQRCSTFLPPPLLRLPLSTYTFRV